MEKFQSARKMAQGARKKGRGESRYQRTKRDDDKGDIKQKLVYDRLAEI